MLTTDADDVGRVKPSMTVRTSRRRRVTDGRRYKQQRVNERRPTTDRLHRAAIMTTLLIRLVTACRTTLRDTRILVNIRPDCGIIPEFRNENSVL